MKKIYILSAMFLFLAASVIAQDSVTVTFRVALKGSGRALSPNGICVTGALNATSQPNWSPGGAKRMTLLSATDSVFTIDIKIPRPAATASDTVFFKFVTIGELLRLTKMSVVYQRLAQLVQIITAS
jgi:hypothetical protein